MHAAQHPAEGLTLTVYFIRCSLTGLVKIGHTSGVVRQRLSSNQTGSAAELLLERAVPGPRAYEQELHRTWAHRHARGEWYRLTAEEVAGIPPGAEPSGPAPRSEPPPRPGPAPKPERHRGPAAPPRRPEMEEIHIQTSRWRSSIPDPVRDPNAPRPSVLGFARGGSMIDLMTRLDPKRRR